MPLASRARTAFVTAALARSRNCGLVMYRPSLSAGMLPPPRHWSTPWPYSDIARACQANPEKVRMKIRRIAKRRAMHDRDSYSRWIHQQVRAALDDPRPTIPHEVVKAEFAARRAALLART